MLKAEKACARVTLVAYARIWICICICICICIKIANKYTIFQWRWLNAEMSCARVTLVACAPWNPIHLSCTRGKDVAVRSEIVLIRAKLFSFIAARVTSPRVFATLCNHMALRSASWYFLAAEWVWKAWSLVITFFKYSPQYQGVYQKWSILGIVFPDTLPRESI